ncbi:MAG: hypothetical protein WCJ41_11840 [Aestuariivirga sp.]|jgi:hypothetical protein|uniref:hypothetical protein n=1 Tax=Aestuariivirga sp. TaxID=2650926 RepID=UPI0030172C60
MSKKATKTVAAKPPTRSAETKKAIAVTSVKPAKKAVAKKIAGKQPAMKTARRSTADVAKLRKLVISGSKAKKPAEVIAKELGISKTYVYALKRKA